MISSISWTPELLYGSEISLSPLSSLSLSINQYVYLSTYLYIYSYIISSCSHSFLCHMLLHSLSCTTAYSFAQGMLIINILNSTSPAYSYPPPPPRHSYSQDMQNERLVNIATENHRLSLGGLYCFVKSALIYIMCAHHKNLA